MIDETARRLVEQMMDVELAEEKERLAKDILRIQGEFNSRNTLQSSMYVDAVCQRCEDEVRGRSQRIWVTFTKVLNRAGFQRTAEFVEELKMEIERYLPPGLPDLTERMDKTIAFINAPGTPGFIDYKRRVDDQLERVRRLAIQKLSAEIDLLALAKAPETANTATVNIHGNVGAVQTGPYATSTINIALSAEDRDTIRRALDLAIESLRRATTPITSGPQIIDMAEEARAELDKAAPNNLKLSSYLQGIATSIQTIGSLSGVYEAVKLALLPFGVTLP